MTAVLLCGPVALRVGDVGGGDRRVIPRLKALGGSDGDMAASEKGSVPTLDSPPRDASVDVLRYALR